MVDKDTLKNIDLEVRTAVANGKTLEEIIAALKDKYAKTLGMKKLAKHVQIAVGAIVAENRKKK